MTITEILEAHRRKGGIRDMRTHCVCGWKSADGDLGDMFHRAHVAEVLEQHMREAKAAAWDEGFEDGRNAEHNFTGKFDANPYREEA